jgi:hypothetical protein
MRLETLPPIALPQPRTRGIRVPFHQQRPERRFPMTRLNAVNPRLFRQLPVQRHLTPVPLRPECLAPEMPAGMFACCRAKSPLTPQPAFTRLAALASASPVQLVLPAL